MKKRQEGQNKNNTEFCVDHRSCAIISDNVSRSRKHSLQLSSKLTKSTHAKVGQSAEVKVIDEVISVALAGKRDRSWSSLKLASLSLVLGIRGSKSGLNQAEKGNGLKYIKFRLFLIRDSVRDSL